MPYAETTKVPILKTQAEICELVQRAGATTYGTATEGGRGIVFFRLKNRMIRFMVEVPDGEQKSRTRWRALLLILKAKIEAINTGIVTMEDEFLAQTMTGDGGTVSDHIQPIIERNFIEGGTPQFKLPAPRP